MAQLNDEQRKAFVETLQFLNDPNRKHHSVSGGAGVGKTFFISKVADDILKHTNADVHLRNVAITATTNKAAAVLQEAMPHKRGDIGTIYSMMNLRVQSNFNTGEQSLTPTRNWAVHTNTLIIVDEASMVSRSLWEYIDKGTSSDCKILFVGDKNQLAPVKETLSPVYASAMSESLLSVPVRNAEQPALMELCEQAKQTVLTGKFTPIKEVPGVIDFLDGTAMQGLLEREYGQEDPTKRVLCYTNKRVLEYNAYIRELRGYTKAVEVGEVLTNNQSAELATKERLYTDQMVKVVSIDREYENDTLIADVGIPMLDLTVQCVSDAVTYYVTVFADPNDRTEAMKYYSSRKKWHPYFKIRDNYPDLRPVSASTTHKAQGSTYQSVIVDLADIGKSTNKEQTARMQYVALSRPKTRLYIRGELPERYFT